VFPFGVMLDTATGKPSGLFRKPRCEFRLPVSNYLSVWVHEFTLLLVLMSRMLGGWLRLYCHLVASPRSMDARPSVPHPCILDDRIRTSAPWFPLPLRSEHCKSFDLFLGCSYTTGENIS
jgi:hypothetical protein